MEQFVRAAAVMTLEQLTVAPLLRSHASPFACATILL